MPGAGATRFASLRSSVVGAAGVARAARVAITHSADPHVDGRLRVHGLDADVEVLRDRHGVPHVFARGEADALFGQGFVHAQDRLFQMDAMRRLAAGRLAELAGPSLLESDRFMRRLGLAHLARRDLESARPGDRALLEAYAAGVNAGIATLHALPPEFALLGAPEPWLPSDSMLVGRMVTFSFGGNWDTELLRDRLLRRLGPGRAAAVDAAYPAGRLTQSGEPSPAGVDRLLAAYEAATAAGLPSGGVSNAWAVSAARTTSGAPLLAGDPHLETRLPGLFHVSHVSGGAIDAVGADIPGVAGIALGHNRSLAWSITAGMADVADCYVETVDPADPARYLAPDGWRRGTVRVERIDVRGAAPVEERVLETRHGPVIGPAVPGEDRVVALRSTALEPGEIVSPFLDAWRAESVQEFEAALDRWPGATFNWVFAHVDGHIGYRLAGDVPRRAASEGLLPQDGAAAPDAPAPLPPSELPRRFDPADGIVVSANHHPGGNAWLGAEWCEPWRAERIRALIEARDRHDVDSFAAMQSDVYSGALVGLRDRLLAHDAVEDPAVRALLSAWDGRLTAASAAAALLETVFQVLARELATRLAGPEAPIVLGQGAGAFSPQSSFHYRLQGWLLDRLDEPAANGPNDAWHGEDARDRLLTAAVTGAVADLDARLGADRARWSWGALHPLRFDHLLRPVPGVGRWFSRGPYPFGGDVNTVCQGGYSVHAGADASGFTPAYRHVIDLGDFDRSRFMLPTGNSGIPGHARYDDCIDDYLAGRTRPLLMSRAAVDAALEDALRLEPA
jgi:penicillin amidase